MVSAIYLILCFVVPSILWQWRNRKHLEGKKYKMRHMVWTYVFMLFCLFAIVASWGMVTLWDIIDNGLSVYFHILPFSLPVVRWYVYNVIIFVPIGFLLPLIWENFRDFEKVANVGWLFSAFIELNQMFGDFATIDEFIMRPLGAMVGYFIWCVFHEVFKKSGEKAIGYCTAEPIIYIELGMAGYFFLYNWRLFY